MTTRTVITATAVLTLAALAFAGAVYGQLPEKIPTHWNLHGEVDGWSDKRWAAYFGPLMMVGVAALLQLLAHVSPRQFEVEDFRPTYNYVTLLLVLLMGYFHVMMLLGGLYPHLEMGRVLIAGLMLFIALLGNVLGKVRRNFWMGVRTPWTLASDRVWIATHRLSARLMVVIGVLGALAALAGAPLAAVFGVFFVTFLVPVVYSLVLYKRLEREGQLS